MKKQIILICLPVLLISCSVDKIITGDIEIDVSEYDLEKYNLKLLNFNFYWNQLVQNTPDETWFTDTITGHVGYWVKYKNQYGEKIPATGYGTFHFKLTNIKQENLYLCHGLISSACRIWCNNKLVYSFGKVAKTKGKTKETAKSGIAALPIKNNQADIYIEVSSYSFYTGGITRPLYIGTRDNTIAYFEKKGLSDFGLICFVLAIVLYNLVVSFFKIGTDKSNLFFALFCLLGLMRQMCLGTIPLTIWFPEFPPKLFHLVKHLGFMLGTYFAAHFFYILFKKDMNKFVYKTMIYSVLGLSILFMFFPVTYGLQISVLFQFVLIAAVFYISYVILKSVNRKNFESLIPLSGLILFFAFIMHDVMVANNIIQGEFKQRFGFLAFAVSQITYLSIRYNKITSQLEFTQLDLQKVSAFTKIQSDKEQQLLEKLKTFSTNTNSSDTNDLTYEIRKHIVQKEVLLEQKIAIENIDKLNTEFFHRLAQKFPDLTKNESELCGYLRAGMKTKDIAQIRNIAPESVKRAKARLRKKLHLQGGTDLYEFLVNQ